MGIVRKRTNLAKSGALEVLDTQSAFGLHCAATFLAKHIGPNAKIPNSELRKQFLEHAGEFGFNGLMYLTSESE